MSPLKKKEQSNAGGIQGPQNVGPSASAAGFSASLQSSFGQGRHLSARQQCCLLQPGHSQCKQKPPTSISFYNMLEKLLICTALFFNEGHCRYLWVLRKTPKYFLDDLLNKFPNFIQAVSYSSLF